MAVVFAVTATCGWRMPRKHHLTVCSCDLINFNLWSLSATASLLLLFSTITRCWHKYASSIVPCDVLCACMVNANDELFRSVSVTTGSLSFSGCARLLMCCRVSLLLCVPLDCSPAHKTASSLIIIYIRRLFCASPPPPDESSLVAGAGGGCAKALSSTKCVMLQFVTGCAAVSACGGPPTPPRLTASSR